MMEKERVTNKGNYLFPDLWNTMKNNKQKATYETYNINSMIANHKYCCRKQPKPIQTTKNTLLKICDSLINTIVPSPSPTSLLSLFPLCCKSH